MSNGLGPVMAGNTAIPGLYNFLNFFEKINFIQRIQ
jgi:hypothetical protein